MEPGRERISAVMCWSDPLRPLDQINQPPPNGFLNLVSEVRILPRADLQLRWDQAPILIASSRLVERVGCPVTAPDQSRPYNILFLTTDQTYAHVPFPEGYELPKPPPARRIRLGL